MDKIRVKDFKTDIDWWNFGKRLIQEPEYQNYIKGWASKKAGQLKSFAIQSLAQKFNVTQNVIIIAFNKYMYGGK